MISHRVVEGDRDGEEADLQLPITFNGPTASINSIILILMLLNISRLNRFASHA
jgi:hypothetical protein